MKKILNLIFFLLRKLKNEKISNYIDSYIWLEFKKTNLVLNDYLKPYKTPSELVKKLSAQGIDVSDTTYAEKIIFTHNYYRLKAYFVPFLNQQDKFYSGTKFSDVYELYLIDEQLRSFILPLLAKLEVRIRAVIDNVVTSKTGDPFWHVDRTNFEKFNNVALVLNKVERRVAEGNQEFIKHYKNRYYTKKSYEYRKIPPFWIVSEIFTLEQLYTVAKSIKQSKFMDSNGQQVLNSCAIEFGFDKYNSLITNLKCIQAIRNMCAHHSRVWNANYQNPSDISKKLKLKPANTNRLYSQLVMIRVMCKAQEINDGIKNYILDLISKNSILTRDQKSMGFPCDWHTDSIWE